MTIQLVPDTATHVRVCDVCEAVERLLCEKLGWAFDRRFAEYAGTSCPRCEARRLARESFLALEATLARKPEALV